MKLSKESTKRSCFVLYKYVDAESKVEGAVGEKVLISECTSTNSLSP